MTATRFGAPDLNVHDLDRDANGDTHITWFGTFLMLLSARQWGLGILFFRVTLLGVVIRWCLGIRLGLLLIFFLIFTLPLLWRCVTVIGNNRLEITLVRKLTHVQGLIYGRKS